MKILLMRLPILYKKIHEPYRRLSYVEKEANGCFKAWLKEINSLLPCKTLLQETNEVKHKGLIVEGTIKFALDCNKDQDIAQYLCLLFMKAGKKIEKRIEGNTLCLRTFQRSL